MIQNVSAAAISAAPIKSPANPKSAPLQATTPVAAVARAPSAAELNAKAFLQRQQIGAALYDRSFTFKEGVAALKRQEAIAAYAEKIQATGASDKELRILDRKLDRAAVQISKLSNNGKGADLDSLAAIDGKELDTVQENLMNRIKAGMKDGSLTEDEAKGLLARHEEINKLEVKLRESDGKLTAGEQKQMLDQLRKEADKVNALRHNNNGVNLTYKSYSDGVDNRQAALEKELERGIARGSLTEKEVAKVKEAFASAQQLEDELRADGRVDWKDSVKMSTALNDVEIALYDLQRNKQGKQLADSFVDVKHADQRQAQMLESTARGISNKSLTDGEGVELLNAQQKVQNSEDRYLKDDGKLDRGEYLRLQSQMNDFSLRNHELQHNADRWTGIMKDQPATGGPKPLPPISVSDGPKGTIEETSVGPQPPVVVICAEPPVQIAVAVCEGPMVAVCETPAQPQPVAETPVSVAAPEVAQSGSGAAPVAAAPASDQGRIISSVGKAESAPAPVVAQAKPIADKYGSMLSGMLDGVNKGAGSFHAEASERKEKHEDRGNHFGWDKKDDVKGIDPRVAAYAKIDAGKGHSENLRKVA